MPGFADDLRVVWLAARATTTTAVAGVNPVSPTVVSEAVKVADGGVAREQPANVADPPEAMTVVPPAPTALSR